MKKITSRIGLYNNRSVIQAHDHFFLLQMLIVIEAELSGDDIPLNADM